jgi:hypothetical protein
MIIEFACPSTSLGAGAVFYEKAGPNFDDGYPVSNEVFESIEGVWARIQDLGRE